MRIGAAKPAEAEALAAAYDWLFAAPGARPPQWDPGRASERLRQAATSSRAAVLVAQDGDAIVGFCTVYLDIESVRFGLRAWVEDLAVDPAHRSRGHGKELLGAAKDWARERGASHLELDSADSRVDAHRFYRREGPSWESRSFGWLL